jgi:TolB-like protein
LEAKKVSNADGKTETSVHNILALHEKKHRISARFDYGQLASQFNSKPNEGFLDPLNSEKVLFHYFIKTPEWGSEKSFAWKKGITGMVNQIIRNISPGGNPKVGIVEFKDLRLNRILPFSRILEEDFKTILIQAENLTVKEVPEPEEDQTPYDLAQRAGVDFYISGSYRMERQGLEIRGQLTETSSGYIFSSAQVQIARNEIYPDDLNELIPSVSPGKLSKPADGYDANLEKLIFTRPSDSSFKIKVWTKKSDYRIGDTITFKVESEKDCYLTLLHIDSSGNATVIFPNKYRRNNFLKTRKVYIIPSPGYGKIDVEGPPGLERIIALATLTPGAPIDLNPEKGFYRIERGTNRGTRDIKIIADRFSTDKASTWAQAYTEVFIYEKEKVYSRGSRQIPLPSKPKKPKDTIGTFGSKLKMD